MRLQPHALADADCRLLDPQRHWSIPHDHYVIVTIKPTLLLNCSALVCRSHHLFSHVLLSASDCDRHYILIQFHYFIGRATYQFCPDGAVSGYSYRFLTTKGSLTCAACTRDLRIYRPSPIGLGADPACQGSRGTCLHWTLTSYEVTICQHDRPHRPVTRAFTIPITNHSQRCLTALWDRAHRPLDRRAPLKCLTFSFKMQSVQ